MTLLSICHIYVARNNAVNFQKWSWTLVFVLVACFPPPKSVIMPLLYQVLWCRRGREDPRCTQFWEWNNFYFWSKAQIRFLGDCWALWVRSASEFPSSQGSRTLHKENEERDKGQISGRSLANFLPYLTSRDIDRATFVLVPDSLKSFIAFYFQYMKRNAVNSLLVGYR